MYSFTNDYSEGAHPKIMKALIETNDEQCAGYGLDKYCLEATRLLKRQLQNDNVDIHYLVGGTQTNAVFISSVLRPYQAVIAADSGHINVHETGAIEATGHKVLTRPHQDGKLTVAMIESIIEEHSDEHMVQPKMVYISQSTEYGSVYSLDELKDIATLCKKKELYLFVDGARLGSALALPDTPTFKDLADYSDAFYIGGTKMGALFGECLVIVNDSLKADFRYNMKPSQTNQVFPIMDDELIAKLQQDFSFNIMDRIDDHRHCIRLVTSWATPKEAVNSFVSKLSELLHNNL